MPCFAVNWPTVSSPLIASSATFALNSAEYLFRFPVIGSVLPSGRTKLNHLSSFRGPPHLATPALRQHGTGQIEEAERVVQFPGGQQSGVRGAEFEPQTPVEIDPQSAVIRFTRWVFHEPTIMINTTR
jgi:hypothetical protein